MTRRDLLRLMGATAVGGALSGCAKLASEVAGSEAPSLPKGDVSAELRLTNRMGFGPRPGDLEVVRQLGHAAYVEQQLQADQKEEPRLYLLLNRLDILRMDGEELQDLPRPEMIRQLQQATLLRAVYGKNQLFERMVDFWSNHFNIYALKANGPYRLPADMAGVIRENALGSFPVMLKASARSPAMLDYLDNTVNRSGVANENYARELLELHTLGVHGGYSQREVMEVARCFTGWTVEQGFLKARGRFKFDPAVHDDGEKTVLGVRIPAGGGIEDGDRVLDILSHSPATARHLAGKLSVEFLGHEDERLIAAMATAYQASDGDIKAVLKPLLLSRQLLDSPAIPKRPLDYVASSLRTIGSDTDCGKPLLSRLESMGQGPYLWPMPDGYPMKAEAWEGSMLARWNFALDLAGGSIAGTGSGLDEHPVSLVLSRKPSGDKALDKAVSRLSRQEGLALCLASPEFQWR